MSVCTSSSPSWASTFAASRGAMVPKIFASRRTETVGVASPADDRAGATLPDGAAPAADSAPSAVPDAGGRPHRQRALGGQRRARRAGGIVGRAEHVGAAGRVGVRRRVGGERVARGDAHAGATRRAVGERRVGEWGERDRVGDRRRHQLRAADAEARAGGEGGGEDADEEGEELSHADPGQASPSVTGAPVGVARWVKRVSAMPSIVCRSACDSASRQPAT